MKASERSGAFFLRKSARSACGYAAGNNKRYLFPADLADLRRTISIPLPPKFSSTAYSEQMQSFPYLN